MSNIVLAAKNSTIVARRFGSINRSARKCNYCRLVGKSKAKARQSKICYSPNAFPQTSPGQLVVTMT